VAKNSHSQRGRNSKLANNALQALQHGWFAVGEVVKNDASIKATKVWLPMYPAPPVKRIGGWFAMV